MRDIISLWCGQPSEDKCPKCGQPFYPVMRCPKCGYKTTVTNICRICMVNMVIAGRESHFCSKTSKNISRKIKGYVNQGTIYEEVLGKEGEKTQ
jgi:hypothetical protein